MKVRGWVYAIANPSIPSLIKIGYSTKDPAGRAREFSGTGVPHPYSVVFDVLVWDPKSVETLVHQRLAVHRENKEWFRVTPQQAIQAIRSEAAQFLSDSSVVHAQPEIGPHRSTGDHANLVKASPTLAPFVGNAPISRAEATRLVWEYIKKHQLQDEVSRTMIRADAALRPVFEKDLVSMFEMTKQISKHLTPYAEH